MTITTPTPRQLWTAKDVAHFAQLHEGTVRNMRAAGKLPDSLRIGRAVRWEPETIIRFFTEGETK